MATSVLVTGAAGFAGSHLVELLAGTGSAVTAWAHRAAVPPTIQAAATWQAVDLLDRQAVDCALAAIERHARHARVVVTSSALIYKHTAEPLREDSPIGPAGPYAVSKLAQDTLAARAAARGLDVIVARPFNHIGPRQSADFVASSVARQVALIERGQMSPE